MAACYFSLSFSLFGRPTFISFIVRRGNEIKKKEAQIISGEMCARSRQKKCLESVLLKQEENNKSGKDLKPCMAITFRLFLD